MSLIDVMVSVVVSIYPLENIIFEAAIMRGFIKFGK